MQERCLNMMVHAAGGRSRWAWRNLLTLAAMWQWRPSVRGPSMPRSIAVEARAIVWRSTRRSPHSLKLPHDPRVWSVLGFD